MPDGYKTRHRYLLINVGWRICIVQACFLGWDWNHHQCQVFTNRHWWWGHWCVVLWYWPLSHHIMISLLCSQDKFNLFINLFIFVPWLWANIIAWHFTISHVVVDPSCLMAQTKSPLFYNGNNITFSLFICTQLYLFTLGFETISP